ncbi:MAG: DNA primase [Chloroflexi bacterium]|nr:DNA primase [Chloroflexota bacterium]
MRVTDEIKSRLDIVDLISETVSLRRSGRSYAGFCPFHPNTRTPAFFVFPETQTWRCFGACAEGGDIFSFVMKQNGWDFKEALQNLAKRAGVELQPRKPVDKKKKAREEKLADLLSAASDYFHQLFLHAPQAAVAREYIQKRGLTEQTIETFQIGFALHSWDACRSHFNGQGYTDEDLLAAGLLTENPDKGTRYDRFRNRLLIPICDVDGRTVGFGARTLEKEGIPKYLNSPQTVLFDKSRLLFGLDMARRHIREARQAVIVEGYMDVLQAWQAGFRNVIAQMGTALTEAQLRQLKRYTKTFVLALDADAAGMKATLRSLQVARETLDREVEVKFDAHGLVRHEGRLKADIRIVTLPEGQDPDDIIRQSPEQWPQLVAQAKPVTSYVIDVLTADLDMNDAKGKTAVAQQIIPLIKDISEPVERDHYWQQLARALQIEERALRMVQIPERRRPSPIPPPPPPTNGKSKPRGGYTAVPGATPIIPELRQENFLRQCLRNRQILRLVDTRLQSCDESLIGEADFDRPEDKALIREIRQMSASPAVVTNGELWDSLDDVLHERVDALLALPPSPENEPERLADTLVLSVLDWRLVQVKKEINAIKQHYRDAQAANDQDVLETYQHTLQELLLVMLRLNKARDAMSASGRRRSQDDEKYGRK